MSGKINLTGAVSGKIGTVSKAAGGAGGKHASQQVFTSSGTWTKPAGITNVFVETMAAGGGGTGHGEGGGAGGYAAEWIDVSAVSSVIVTVGTAGVGVTYSSTAGTGGTSSFGSYSSCIGGQGGLGGNGHRGGHGGAATGGAVNFRGGAGTAHCDCAPGPGGASYMGGGTVPGASTTCPMKWDSHGGYGGGGAAAWTTTGRGAHGCYGVVIVWEYS